MKLRLVDFYLFSIPVDFRISWGKLGYSRHVVLVLEDENGTRGIGEGVLYKTTHLQTLPYINNNFNGWFESTSINNHLKFEPALVFALDTAILDIQGKIVDKIPQLPITEEVFINGEVKVSSHTRFLKLKVGQGINKDIETISKFNKKYKLKLDANRAYSSEEAAILAGQENVVLFEEPVKGGNVNLKNLKNITSLPIMLDESILTLEDLKKAINEKCFDVLNVKLTRLGGISNAKKYVDLCQKNNIKVSLGCSEELDFGMKAIFSFASTIKDLYGVEGFGPKRLGLNIDEEKLNNGKFTKIFTHNGKNSFIFLLLEFYGVWKTRLENVKIKIIG